jgi:pimeloyl-ACP methyl ester carboxylesterase
VTASNRSIAFVAMGILMSATGVITQAITQGDAVRPKDNFVTVNGIRLHYVDWGGRGETILFLTGLGERISTFDSFAPKFTDHFLVLGLDRRGQGQSAKPLSGYDTETLVDDIRGFLEVMRINRITLIGHSIAGTEMTRFAEVYPKRLENLVYLDAAYDNARGNDILVEAKLPLPKFASDSVAAIYRGASQTHPDYAKVTVPALAFFVVFDSPYVTPQMDEESRRWNEAAFYVFEENKREQIELFRTKVKRGHVIELHDTNHTFFNDPKQRDNAVGEIRKFLLNN